MSQNVTWNGTTYAIPLTGELNWSALSAFLIDLGTNAAITQEADQAIRVALTTPVTVAAATDYAVVTDLTTPGAVAVNLPAGVDGQVFVIVDGKGDAGTNNITITPAAGTIAGSATLVLTHNRQTVMLQYHTGTTDWKVLANTLYPGTITSADISGTIAPSKGGTGIANNDAATLTRSGNHALTVTTTGATNVTLPTSGTLVASPVGIADGGTGQTAQTAAFDALAPTTTKGDLIAHNGSDNIRVAVGTNGQALVADSAQASGLAYANVATLPVSLTTGVSGTLPLANGGTNATTAQGALNNLAAATTDNRVLQGNGTNIVLGQIDDPAFFTSGANATSSLPGLIPTYVKNTFTASLVKSGGSGTLGTATVVSSRYVKVGSLCHVELHISPITVSTNTVTLDFTLPFAAKSSLRPIFNANDNGTAGTGRVILAAGSSTAGITPSLTSSSWAVSAANTTIFAIFDYEVDE